jgi:hypothetical protein
MTEELSFRYKVSRSFPLPSAESRGGTVKGWKMTKIGPDQLKRLGDALLDFTAVEDARWLDTL